MKRVWASGLGSQTWSDEVLALCFATLRNEEIDWPGLRAAAVAIGIRPAARQAARDLPLDERERFVQRAMKRCSRQKWLVKSEQVKANSVATSPTALSADVRKGADVLSEILAEDSRETRLSLSTAARKHAEHFAGLAPSIDHKRAIAVKNWQQVAAGTHGWSDRDTGTEINLNVLTISGSMRASPSQSNPAQGSA